MDRPSGSSKREDLKGAKESTNLSGTDSRKVKKQVSFKDQTIYEEKKAKLSSGAREALQECEDALEMLEDMSKYKNTIKGQREYSSIKNKLRNIMDGRR